MKTHRIQVEFRVEKGDKATCACGATFKPIPDGRFQVSPHLIEKHGFKEGQISFEITSESICPPIQFVQATNVAPAVTE